MADLDLKINGDSSGAQGALHDAGGAVGDLSADVGKSVVKWQEFANVTKAAIESVVKFGVDAVKAYAESERVQKQLTRAAGEYADALSDQAEALSRKYAVDDDIIKQSQVLLTQWGGVGAATEGVTKAVLNYAAATGQDAVSATSDLIRNVESGGAGLAKMGVHFTATGDKGKDLAAAIGAINKKFGGAAAADADSLIGQTHAADLAFEDLQKNLGGAIAEMVRASGILPKLTSEIRKLTDALFTPEATKKAEDPAFIAQQVKYWEDITAGNVIGYKDFATKTQFTFEEAQAKLAEWRAKMRPDDFNLTGQKQNEVSGQTNFGIKKAAAAGPKQDALEAQKEFYKSLDAIEEHAREQEQQSFADSLAAEGKHVHDSIELRKDQAKEYEAIRVAEEKKTAEWEEKQAQSAQKAQEEASKRSADAVKRREQEWAQAGDAIGAAFVNALSDQLGKLAAGEEFDAAIFVGDILASVISVAATVIGTAYGQPALGAAVGNLASMGVRAGAAAISKGNKKKYHTGGWIGDEAELPRYHSGGYLAPDEVPMIGQKGEYMLSRRNVADMGGPAGVERAIKGGGGTTISLSVMAIDAKNAAEGFVGELGAGLKRALRTGQGDVPALLGVSPR